MLNKFSRTYVCLRVRIQLRRVLTSFALTLLTLFLLFLWMNSPYSFPQEANFLKLQSTIKSTLEERLSEKTVKSTINKEICLIDAGSSGILVDHLVTQTNERIVDRVLVDSLIRLLNQHPNPERIILCDLDFDIPLSCDTSLAKTIRRTPHFYWPEQSASSSVILKQAVPRDHTGYVNVSFTNEWRMLSESLLKFQLSRADGSKSMVLKAYEGEHHIHFQYKNGFLWLDGQVYANNLTIDETIRTYDLNNADLASRKYPIKYALELIEDNDELTTDFINCKYVVIGAFNSDIHSTAFGTTWGCLINLNLLLSLEKKENQFQTTWVLLLIASITGIIHYALYGKERGWVHTFKAVVNRYTGVLIGETLLHIPALYLVSLISYFIFNNTIEVIACSAIIGLLLGVRSIIVRARLVWKKHYLKDFSRHLNFIFTGTKSDTKK